MVDALAGLEHRTIETKVFLGRGFTKQIEAWCWQDFAVRRCLEYQHLWLISLLPLGMPLPVDWCSFERFEDAVACMREFAALRNDWHVIRQADLTKKLEARMRAIARKHNAAQHDIVGAAGWADRDKFNRVMRRRPNGYGAVLDR